MGSSSKNEGVNSKEIKKNEGKLKKQSKPSPYPRIWWIRIKLTLQERWIDPDPSGSWSMAEKEKRVDRVLGQPDPHTRIKGVLTRIFHFSFFSSFFSSPPFSFPHKP